MNKKKLYVVLILHVVLCIILTMIIFTFDSCAEQEVLAEGAYVMEEYEREGDSEQVVPMQLSDIELLAKTVYGEARGCSTLEQSAVIWCILNRVDAGQGTIEDVITAPYQFTGYSPDNPLTEEFMLLAEDVLARWTIEKHCIGEVGRTLPREYKWFIGDGKENIFRDQYDGDYNIWDWNCYNPYP